MRKIETNQTNNRKGFKWWYIFIITFGLLGFLNAISFILGLIDISLPLLGSNARLIEMESEDIFMLIIYTINSVIVAATLIWAISSNRQARLDALEKDEQARLEREQSTARQREDSERLILIFEQILENMRQDRKEQREDMKMFIKALTKCQ